MLGRSDCSEDKRGIDYNATTDFVLLSAEEGKETEWKREEMEAACGLE